MLFDGEAGRVFAFSLCDMRCSLAVQELRVAEVNAGRILSRFSGMHLFRLDMHWLCILETLNTKSRHVCTPIRFLVLICFTSDFVPFGGGTSIQLR